MKNKGLMIAVSVILTTALSFGAALAGGRGDSVPGENPEAVSHSAPAAVLSSFLPVWSGSWNLEFTGWGLALVILKTGSGALLGYSIATYDPDKSAMGFTGTTESDGKSSTSRISDSAVLIGFSAAFLVMGVIGDCIYSGLKVKRHNATLEEGNAFSLGSDSLFLAIEPKVELSHGRRGEIPGSPGCNVRIIRKF